MSLALPRSVHSRRRAETLRALRKFLVADRPVPRRIRVTDAEIVRAAPSYLRVGERFRRGGLAEALPAMPALPPDRDPRAGESEEVVFAARSAAWRLHGLGRTLTGTPLCLHESLALCAGLRVLGFQAHVAIGYPVIEKLDDPDELHAWTVIGERAITDQADAGRPMQFAELLRLPRTVGAP
ncbi:hypothetical protein C1I98_34210 [Spongiactinospora gelatinilytica]|uniref:Microcin J25-processing protein McjB C-terminal domain-containing protein n=1 Tax=Spongiactinospora gelatinilytica TaxID=2666298 RepID=A0A2W2FL31_9ACTN|nr:lasso peptide biosynthesis protein [Spongiactinospora gelatinilytica]PZG26020.1 hypothetical protein C1I98_34210 [Spongiactinospora gelatinilytica]